MALDTGIGFSLLTQLSTDHRRSNGRKANEDRYNSQSPEGQ